MDIVEKEKLKILLNHWIEHNREHSEEFRKWADKARSSGQDRVHNDIAQAIRQMNEVNGFLLQALEKLMEG